MKDLLDSDGENRAVRNFLMFYGGGHGINTKSMRYTMTMSGFDGAWPECANADMHLTKAGAQLWLRHLFDLEKKIDTSEEHVHESDKNVHVPTTTRALNEIESELIRSTGLKPEKFVRVLSFNDRPVSIRDMPDSFRQAVRDGLRKGTLIPS